MARYKVYVKDPFTKKVKTVVVSGVDSPSEARAEFMHTRLHFETERLPFKIKKIL